MDDERARRLLAAEHSRVKRLLDEMREAAGSDRLAEDAPGDMSDPAERLTAEGTDDAMASGFRGRLEAIQRAEARLAAGTYGRSTLSGNAIPDERLEADPAAELTVEEAARVQGAV